MKLYFFLVCLPLFPKNNNYYKCVSEIQHEDYHLQIAVDKIVKNIIPRNKPVNNNDVFFRSIF